MPELQRTPISISIFKPQVIVDIVEGCWFAVVSDGSTQVTVTEWPLWDCQFFVEACTVLRIELYTAHDEVHFARNECSKFSEVYIPAAKVMSGHGGAFRSWLGLQKGYFVDDVSFQIALERYEVSLALAKCLLTPKICISALTASTASLEGIRSARDGAENDGVLRQSVVQHSTIITSLNQQMYALWLEGRIVTEEAPTNGGISAHLIDANIDESSLFVGGSRSYDKLSDAESRLQVELSRLTESIANASSRLEESERLKAAYRERLTELTGELFEEDDCMYLEDGDIASVQALQRETKHLQEKLQAERARLSAAQKDLQALRSRGVLAGSWKSREADELKSRHCDELRQISQVHAVEVDAFRAAEHEQRLLAQELQRKNDILAQDVIRKQAQVTVLQDEIGELTARFVEAWRSKAQSSGASSDDCSHADRASSFAKNEIEELRQELLCSEVASTSTSNHLTSTTSKRKSSAFGSVIERAESVVQEFQNDTSACLSARELLLFGEVGRLVSFAIEVQSEREGSQIGREDPQQDASGSARVDVEDIKEVLSSKSLEQNKEVLELRANLQKEKQALKEQADSHEEVLHQRDAQHGRQLEAVFAEISMERQARLEIEEHFGEAQEAKLLCCNRAEYHVANDREERLRCEVQDLEDANLAMSQQAQRQFDDFASLQERFSREILTFRKEQAILEEGPASITKLQQANRALQSEVKELRCELIEERKRRNEAEEVKVLRRPLERSVVSASGGVTSTRCRPAAIISGSSLSTYPSQTASPQIGKGRQMAAVIRLSAQG